MSEIADFEGAGPSETPPGAQASMSDARAPTVPTAREDRLVGNDLGDCTPQMVPRAQFSRP